MIMTLKRSCEGRCTKIGVLLDRVHFHRIIADAIHDTNRCHGSGVFIPRHYGTKLEPLRHVLLDLRASFWVGHTDVSLEMSPTVVLRLARLVQVADLPKTPEAAQAFLNVCVCRSVLATEPRIQHRTEFVQRSAPELATAAWRDLHGSQPLLMRLWLANHHKIDDFDARMGGYSGEYSPSGLLAHLARKQGANLNTGANYAGRHQDALAECLGYLHAHIVANPSVATDLRAVGVTVTQPGNVIRISGHAVLALLANSAIARLPAAGTVAVPTIDYAKYGSKIRALVTHVRQVIAADPTPKLILFSQFRRLTTLISRAFSEFKIRNVSMAGGNVFSKRRAVTLFRNDPDMKVLFLSSDDYVSGLHLVEANHVVIVHPLLGASETMSRAYEMQGQAREVTVVQFVARNTVEEEMTTRRMDVRLAPAAMFDGVNEQEHEAAAGPVEDM
ncbi:hypothetical protein GGF32_001842 [Allomyces javanicus]|nr:hypothetical protein GGF32_001842 [Allomyces javanicus]